MTDATPRSTLARSVLDNARRHWKRWLLGAAVAIWVGAVMTQAGAGTLIALWYAALYTGALALITIPVRTLSFVRLLAFFALGAGTIGIAVLAGAGFATLFGTKASAARSLGIPVVEEILKLLPVLWVLAWQRRGRARGLGATDVLLLAAFSGAGFYWVEEAFILHHHTSWGFLGRIPTTDVEGNHMIASHAVWSTIAGATIGIARSLGLPQWPRCVIAVSGYLWSSLDHAANNYGANFSDAFAGALRYVTGNGHHSLTIVALLLVAAMALDAWYAYVKAPRVLRPTSVARPSSLAGVDRWWREVRMRRQGAYAAPRLDAVPAKVRDRFAGIAAMAASAARGAPHAAGR